MPHHESAMQTQVLAALGVEPHRTLRGPGDGVRFEFTNDVWKVCWNTIALIKLNYFY